MGTLKISDLSVGDWVMVNGRPRKISVLAEVWNGSNEVLVGYVAHVNPNGYNVVFYKPIEHVKPIPITAEILEQNGFVKNGEYNEWSNGNWDDIPFIGISLSRPSMRIKNLGTDIFLENKVVYVHQLQHALRLAGVDKEINL